MLEILIDPLLIAAFAFVWIHCLVGPQDIFSFLQKWFAMLKPPRMLIKVLFQCEKCFAGQVAFWLGVADYLAGNETFIIFNVTLSIFFAAFFGRYYKSLK